MHIPGAQGAKHPEGRGAIAGENQGEEMVHLAGCVTVARTRGEDPVTWDTLFTSLGRVPAARRAG